MTSTSLDEAEVGNPRINSPASGLGFLRSRRFFDRFLRRRTAEKCLQILLKRGWCLRSAGIRPDGRTTIRLPSSPRRLDPPRRARDLLGEIPLVFSRSSRNVSGFFRGSSAVWNIAFKLSAAEYRAECDGRNAIRARARFSESRRDVKICC